MRQRISGFVATLATSSKPEEGKGRLVYFISRLGEGGLKAGICVCQLLEQDVWAVKKNGQELVFK